MTFQELNLNTPLLNAITDLGLTQPTPIQEKMFPVVLSGRDAVGIARTGTGKTFAYLLPLLKQLKYSDQKHPRILIIVPTRELVLQVVGEVEKLCKYMNIRVTGVYGGTNINTQKQVVYNGMDILVATPGRLVDIAYTGILRVKSIQKLIIDEVDEMLNLGFRPQLMNFLDSIPQKRQNLMFSATLTEEVAALIESYFYDPVTVEIDDQQTPVEQISQCFYAVPNFHTKVNLLGHLLSKSDEFTRALVFVSGKQVADRVAAMLEPSFSGEMGVIHSNKSQNYRINALERFRSGQNRILIATDVASRGLDIADISHVINFEVPEIAEDYVHRIGRTGRADKLGSAITLVTESELKWLDAIEQFTGRIIDEKPIPSEVKISEIYTEDERPVLFDKDYLGITLPTPAPQGAFHEKKEKNKKVNLGGPGKRNPKKDSPVNRGMLRKRAAKRK